MNSCKRGAKVTAPSGTRAPVKLDDSGLTHNDPDPQGVSCAGSSNKDMHWESVSDAPEVAASRECVKLSPGNSQEYFSITEDSRVSRHSDLRVEAKSDSSEIASNPAIPFTGIYVDAAFMVQPENDVAGVKSEAYPLEIKGLIKASPRTSAKTPVTEVLGNSRLKSSKSTRWSTQACVKATEATNPISKESIGIDQRNAVAASDSYEKGRELNSDQVSDVKGGQSDSPVPVIQHVSPGGNPIPNQEVSLASSKDHSVIPMDRSGNAVDQLSGTEPTTPVLTHSLSSVQAARLMHTLSESQLRVGLQAGEFGKIDIHTSLSQNQISARIYVEHEDLGRVIAGTLPQLHEKLEVQHRLDAQLELHSADSERDDRQQKQQSKLPAQSTTTYSDSQDARVESETPQVVSRTMRSSVLDMHV